MEIRNLHVKRITINLASAESEKLEKYCASTGRPATDVIRELIRSLTITELSASEQTTSTLKHDVPILK
ncbi:CopG family transcriptional regulator [Nostoc sp.]|uniref:CopG family transcriptional regulator n=1 Tax=Nostoc sp. TaxID=1180 RepID=UPI002FF56046